MQCIKEGLHAEKRAIQKENPKKSSGGELTKGGEWRRSRPLSSRGMSCKEGNYFERELWRGHLGKVTSSEGDSCFLRSSRGPEETLKNFIMVTEVGLMRKNPAPEEMVSGGELTNRGCSSNEEGEFQGKGGVLQKRV